MLGCSIIEYLVIGNIQSGKVTRFMPACNVCCKRYCCCLTSCYHDAGRLFPKRIVAYDVETLQIAKGMASFPLWLHKDVFSPTWQYGLISVLGYDHDKIEATIKGTLINSREQIEMALGGSILDKKHNGHAQFQ